MDCKTGSVSKSGIKYRSSSGSLRRPQTVPNWSGTKNRLSHFSGRFEPRSCRRQTDWVPGRLRPPGTKPRLTQDYVPTPQGVLRRPQASPDRDSRFLFCNGTKGRRKPGTKNRGSGTKGRRLRVAGGLGPHRTV